MLKRNLPTIFAFFASILIAGCGGGLKEDNKSDNGPVPAKDACGDLQLRIVDGTTCSKSEISPVVYFQNVVFDPIKNQTKLATCSGTLINPTDVLTAAHCFPTSSDLVLSSTVHVGGTTIAASAYITHPGFSERKVGFVGGSALFNDVAILRMVESTTVPPLPLYTSSSVQSGQIIDIFGYGYDAAQELGVLRSGQMKIDEVTTDHIVAPYDGEGSDTCYGDSGGPAILVDGTKKGIVGITSSGVNECVSGDISVFTNIDSPSVLSFILQNAPGTGQI